MPQKLKNLNAEFDAVFAELKKATDPATRAELLRSLRLLITKADVLIQEFESESKSLSQNFDRSR